MAEDNVASILATMTRDPIATRTIEDLMIRSADALAALVDQVVGTLAEADKKGKQPAAMPTSVQELASAAARRELAAKQRREYAQALVAGALLNYDNPDWNPVDPSTSRLASNNILVQLLQAGTPA
jgi:hypothetical protein